jgi:hypothetical protein
MKPALVEEAFDTWTYQPSGVLRVPGGYRQQAFTLVP